MSQYSKSFNKEFIERTKSILDKYQGNYEVTLLMNCTLALVCLPIEKLKYSNNYPDLEIVSKISENLKSKFENSNNISDLSLLKILRNGIAHLNLKFINEEKKLT